MTVALRPLPLAMAPRQRIHRVLASGDVEVFAEVEFLAGGGTRERTGAGGQAGERTYEGLPPYLAFAAPSGFLGRRLARATAGVAALPADLACWHDDQMLAYLFTVSVDAPGNLLFGDAALQREKARRRRPPVPAAAKPAHYTAMAEASLGTGHVDLGVDQFDGLIGGDQPKFVSLVEGAGHVIVKFARRGTRMAELLLLEHVALRSLAAADVPAARTQLLAAGDHVFLEVQRFDRVGMTGRVGMLSAGAVDDEFFGRRDTWPQFAARCAHAGYLSPEHARRVDTMAAFSELIGNSDRHFENISLLIDEQGEYAGIAPAYDILPMRYASIGGGVNPDLTPIAPMVTTIGAQPVVWALAARAAKLFWVAVQTERLPVPISGEWRALAATNLGIAQEFVARLSRA